MLCTCCTAAQYSLHAMNSANWQQLSTTGPLADPPHLVGIVAATTAVLHLATLAGVALTEVTLLPGLLHAADGLVVAALCCHVAVCCCQLFIGHADLVLGEVSPGVEAAAQRQANTSC